MYHNGCQFSGSKVSISELTPKAVAFTLTVEPTPIPDDSRFLLDLRREARTSFPMKLVEKENKGAEGERLQAFRAGWENCSTPFTAMRKTVSSNSSCACYCLVLPGRRLARLAFLQAKGWKVSAAQRSCPEVPSPIRAPHDKAREQFRLSLVVSGL